MTNNEGLKPGSQAANSIISKTATTMRDHIINKAIPADKPEKRWEADRAAGIYTGSYTESALGRTDEEDLNNLVKNRQLLDQAVGKKLGKQLATAATSKVDALINAHIKDAHTKQTQR